MSSTHRHLLLDVFWQVISGPPCIQVEHDIHISVTVVIAKLKVLLRY
jgi:hypothetical protein